MKKSYRTSLDEQRRRYASELLARRMRKHRGPISPGPKILDNSEPFLANPNSVADAEFIIGCVNQRIAELRGLLPR